MHLPNKLACQELLALEQCLVGPGATGLPPSPQDAFLTLWAFHHHGYAPAAGAELAPLLLDAVLSRGRGFTAQQRCLVLRSLLRCFPSALPQLMQRIDCSPLFASWDMLPAVQLAALLADVAVAARLARDGGGGSRSAAGGVWPSDGGGDGVGGGGSISVNSHLLESRVDGATLHHLLPPWSFGVGGGAVFGGIGGGPAAGAGFFPPQRPWEQSGPWDMPHGSGGGAAGGSAAAGLLCTQMAQRLVLLPGWRDRTVQLGLRDAASTLHSLATVLRLHVDAAGGSGGDSGSGSSGGAAYSDAVAVAQTTMHAWVSMVLPIIEREARLFVERGSHGGSVAARRSSPPPPQHAHGPAASAVPAPAPATAAPAPAMSAGELVTVLMAVRDACALLDPQVGSEGKVVWLGRGRAALSFAPQGCLAAVAAQHVLQACNACLYVVRRMLYVVCCTLYVVRCQQRHALWGGGSSAGGGRGGRQLQAQTHCRMCVALHVTSTRPVLPLPAGASHVSARAAVGAAAAGLQGWALPGGGGRTAARAAAAGTGGQPGMGGGPAGVG